MRVEIDGKETGVGAFADGFVIGYEPDYTDESRTGNHWTHIYKNVSPDAIIVEFGYSRGGRPWRSVRIADGRKVTEEDMKKVETFSEWKEYEP